MGRVAALTMVYKDHWFLQKWLDYYGKELGTDNLFVLNHGGDPEVRELARDAHVTDFPRWGMPSEFDQKKVDLINSYLPLLFEVYDAVIVGDVDELVVLDPRFGDSLQEQILKENNGDTHNCFCWELRPTPGQAPFDLDKPLLEQRPYAMCMPLYCKPAITYRPVKYVPGLHACDAEPALNPKFLLFHTKFANEVPLIEAMKERNDMSKELVQKDGEAARISDDWKTPADEVLQEVQVMPEGAWDDYEVAFRRAHRHMSKNVFYQERRGYKRFPFLPKRQKKPVLLPERIRSLA